MQHRRKKEEQKVLNLIERNPSTLGVATASCGNHGQGLAWAAQLVGIKCIVVVPDSISKAKKTAIKEYGAEVVACEADPGIMVETCKRLSEELNLHYVASSGDVDVITGQATIALELLSQVEILDTILVSVGAGGLASGLCLYAKRKNPELKVFLVEPEGKFLGKCLKHCKRLSSNNTGFLNTIADAISVKQLSERAWQVLLKYSEKEVLTVNDEEIMSAMTFAFERMKLVIEGAAAATMAAVMSKRFQEANPFSNNIGIVICGGNIDKSDLPW